MCGRYVQVQNIKVIEKRFNLPPQEGIELNPNYNVSPGTKAPVITSRNPDKLELFQFGLIPFWSGKKMLLINARAEGDYNKKDDPRFTGPTGIIQKFSFRKPIRSQRCLIIADCFIEGTTKEKLSKPFVVYLRGRRPFAFAGIWDTWMDKETGEEINSFAIITTVSNELIQKIPHHRSPVILHEHEERKWLDPKLPLSDVTAMLKPYPAELMNAYPISNAIKNPRAQGRELVEPAGQRLVSENEMSSENGLWLQGMGSNKRNR